MAESHSRFVGHKDRRGKVRYMRNILQKLHNSIHNYKHVFFSCLINAYTNNGLHNCSEHADVISYVGILEVLSWSRVAYK